MAGGGAHQARGVFVILRGSGKREVCMAIDEARHHHSPGSFELHGVPRLRQIFKPPGWTDFGDYAVTDDHRPIVNRVELV